MVPNTHKIFTFKILYVFRTTSQSSELHGINLILYTPDGPYSPPNSSTLLSYFEILTTENYNPQQFVDKPMNLFDLWIFKNKVSITTETFNH